MIAAGSDPLVSVIVPTYRRHDYLHVSLQSILAQTHRNLEVLVVADGDDAQTRAVVERQEDARVRYLCVPHAGLPAVPRNEGLRQSRGELLCFCDDDDLWHAGKLEAQVSLLRGSDYGLCTTEFGFIDPNGVALDKDNFCRKYHGPIDRQTFFLSMGFICNSASMFTRQAYSVVGGLNEDPRLRALEDFEYWMRILSIAEGFFIGRELVSYRIHAGSIQRSTPIQLLGKRWRLHRHLKHTLGISAHLYWRKLAKLGLYGVFDRFPAVERLFRRIQARS